MEPCSNPLIPPRLHTNDKPEVQIFAVGDVIYRRCKNEWVDDPFGKIPFYDLSANRATVGGEVVSQAEDVRLNAAATSEEELVIKEAVLSLEIKEVDGTVNTYYKELTEEEDLGNGASKSHQLSLKLLHDRTPCNYAHCVFEIRYNGVVVTRDNQKELIGKGFAKRVRNAGRIEIEKMIMYREIWINGDAA